MRVTEDFVLTKFREFNTRFFNSELPEVPVRITGARSYLGKVVYERKRGILGGTRNGNFRFLFSRCLDLEEKVIEDTVIHEMIHYFILFKRLKDTSPHGKIFREMMNRLNKAHGRNITVRHRLTAEDRQGSLTAEKKYMVCVSRMADDRWGITVAMPSKISFLKREISAWEKVKLSRWYYVSGPFFAFFPRSQTVKVYPVSEAELLDAMKNAKELEWRGDKILVTRNQFDPSLF